jgi:hypothetical protein
VLVFGYGLFFTLWHGDGYIFCDEEKERIDEPI